MAMAEPGMVEAQDPLIEAARAGDRYAFAELMRGHGRWVRGVIFGVLGDGDCVDDVAQQVWTGVWQRIGELRDARRFRPWLYRLARNAAIDAGRSITRRRNHMREPGGEIGISQQRSSAPAATPDGDLAQQERHQEVFAAIRGLPALYREPFVLRHLNGWSYSRIAEVMGMPVDSVETRLVRARRLLRDRLKNKVF